MNVTAFWVAQFNIQNPAWRKAGDEPWAKSLPKIVGLFNASGSSVRIANECDAIRAQEIAGLMGPQWAWSRVYPAYPAEVNVVFYDRNKWEPVGLTWRVLPGNGTRTLTAVQLRHRTVTELPVVTVGSTHFEALSSGYAKDAAGAQRLRDEQATAVAGMLPATYTIVGGDINDTDTASGPRQILRDAGMLPLADRVMIRNAQYGTTDDRRTIDELFTTTDIVVTDAERVYVGAASDHHLTRARISTERKPV